MKKELVSCVLYDSTECPTYEEYVEECEMNEVVAQPEGSSAYWDYVSDTVQMWYEDLIGNLKYSDYAKMPCILNGNVGRWNGSFGIMPVRFENIVDAIETCIYGADDCKIELVDGHIEVTGYHHDGRNYFQIDLLSSLGCERLRNDYDGYVPNKVMPYHTKKIWGYLF